ncbi:MAG: hypothetical protein HYV28_10455, partial [Ignavibacteriales bacterium]|nr:hypothetical protein [Ignavibacteriales bacterium]
DLSDSEYIVKPFLDLVFLYKSEHPNIFPTPLKVTAKGWEYYNQIKSKPLGHSAQVFVAMWFDENRRVYYEQGIKPAIEDSTNFKCIRVDTVQHNNKICDQIIAEIRKSKFMVADFTGDRSGVYYEAGFAQGLGIPVIWVVDETDVKNLHFDTRQYNHITYKDAEDLRLKLRARIEATIV